MTTKELTLEQKQAAKLAKLEAAKRTMDRIKELKGVPAELKKLSVELKSIPTKTLKKDVDAAFKIVADVAGVINDAVKREGLDTANYTALNENVAKSFEGITVISNALKTFVSGKFPSQDTISKRVDAMNLALGKIQFIIPAGYSVQGLDGTSDLVQDFADLSYVLDAAQNIIKNIPEDIASQYANVGYLGNTMEMLGTVAKHVKKFHEIWRGMKAARDDDEFKMANEIMEQTPKDVAAFDQLLPFRIAATKKLTTVANVTSDFLAGIGKVVIPDNMKVGLFGNTKSLIGKKTKEKILNTMRSLADIVIDGNEMLSPIRDIGKPFEQMTAAIHAMDLVMARYSSNYFGPSGKIVKTMEAVAETYDYVYGLLFEQTMAPHELEMKLERFANAMGEAYAEPITVKSEALNFEINVKVTLDAEKFSDAMTNKYAMGAKAVALAKDV